MLRMLMLGGVLRSCRSLSAVPKGLPPRLDGWEASVVEAGAAVVAAHDVCLNPNWRRGPCDAHALGNGEIEMCDDVWKRSGCTCRFAKTERPAVWQRSAVW